ncbi:hypothetical protein TrVE_jg1171 [Triparma verrucosa]|uniref:Uncharacterized protein n=1 Tax=Triparma verrucosa TaxID=1606542 RepID=A0A9W7C938_9STRA|nr:hypothetical protein TrVE_jg1171 [Triparma verrucosa]
MSSFSDLDEATREVIRQKQQQKQLAKREKKKKEDLDASPAGASAISGPPLPPFAAERRTKLTSDEYFGAAPGGLFRDPRIPPTAGALDFVMSALDGGDETAAMLGSCNYFQFQVPATSSSGDTPLWDPEFYVRLCHAGFFVITAETGPNRSTQPLPELQPFYGVLHWNEFDAAPRVCKVVKRLRSSMSKQSSEYALEHNKNPLKTWEQINEYHLEKNSTNWLTRRYFDMMLSASEDPKLNFSLNCIDLKRNDEIIGGEMGFTVGTVYTSLSGWTGERSQEAVGFVQLVLLGTWLKQRNYSFWSLGHCYQPSLDYKRLLGQVIYSRDEFRRLLKTESGNVTEPQATSPTTGFEPLTSASNTISATALLSPSGTLK